MLEGFSLIFLSIIFEALPFIIIGSFVSSLITIFVKPELLIKILPRNKTLGLVMASLLGFIFPVCECAIVPIMRGLVKKGVPTYLAITFMLAVPIVNPVVLASTYYAFDNDMTMVFLRATLGIIGAILIGYIVSGLKSSEAPLLRRHHDSHGECSCSHHHEEEHSCGCGHDHHKKDKGLFAVITQVLQHTSHELYDVGKFLILGAFISALMQTFISREAILAVGSNTVTSTLVMMLLAFVLSLCSEADAFIARTFMPSFTTGSILGFLILGPMIDIKNSIMLFGSFKSKFVIKLIGIIILVCFMLAMLINILL
ncbi:permease [Vallitalea okinawensis]|uniref:permease n=1 Tax=Vallitalea okinawensis TaxID=2078660 RepID=UPI000CFB715D|nr:permease [Vallitalea okinawensis]